MQKFAFIQSAEETNANEEMNGSYEVSASENIFTNSGTM
jgi:hypothetical protein